MTEEELRVLHAAMDEFRRSGEISTETMGNLNSGFAKAEKSVTEFSNKTLSAAKQAGSIAGELARGEGSFKSLTGALTGLTSVVGKLASAIPLVGGAAKALADGIGEAGKFVLDQLDQMAKNYQSLGDASATAADGLDGLERQFNQIGLVSLPAFIKAVGQNAKGLSTFAGGTAQGAEELSKLAGALTKGAIGEQFLKLGMNFDTVGDSAARYVSTFARYGGLQRVTQEELTKKTQDYIKEVDLIARMTGQNRQEQEQEQQRSLNDARFRAKIAEMNATGQEKEAAQLDAYVKGLGPAAADAARALLTGVPMTDEANKANMLYGDQIRQSVLDIQAGSKATQELERTMKAGAQGAQNFGKLIQATGTDVFGAGTVGAFDDLARVAKIEELQRKEGLTWEQANQKIQDELLKATGKNTQEFVDAQKATAKASKDLQELGFRLAIYAVPAVNKFAEALAKVTGFINKEFNAGTKPKPGAVVATPDAENKPPATAAPTPSGAPPPSPVPGSVLPPNTSLFPDPLGDRSRRENKPPATSAPTPSVAKPVAKPVAIKPSANLPVATPANAGSQQILNPKITTQAPNLADIQRHPAYINARRQGSTPQIAMDAAKAEIDKEQEKPRLQVQKLLDFIGMKESRGKYDMLVGGKTNPDLSTMTVAQVLEFQKTMIENGHESTAVGKYQIVNSTLRDLVKQNAISLEDTFNSTTQDKAAVSLLRLQGLDSYLAGQLNKDDFADKVAKVWASLPLRSGNSAYHGVGSNKAGASRQEYMTAFARDGGMFSGPKSGYPATLHGSEAVIPLKNGSVPVTMPGITTLVSSVMQLTQSISSVFSTTNSSSFLSTLQTKLADAIDPQKIAKSVLPADMFTNLLKSTDVQPVAQPTLPSDTIAKLNKLTELVTASTATQNTASIDRFANLNKLTELVVADTAKQNTVTADAFANLNKLTDLVTASTTKQNTLTADTFANLTKPSDNMAQFQTAMSEVVKRQTATPDAVINSLMPEIVKSLPNNDASTILAERTDKLSQQLARLEAQSITPPQANDNREQIGLMNEQLAKLDEMVRVMSNQLTVSNKISQRLS